MSRNSHAPSASLEVADQIQQRNIGKGMGAKEFKRLASPATSSFGRFAAVRGSAANLRPFALHPGSTFVKIPAHSRSKHATAPTAKRPPARANRSDKRSKMDARRGTRRARRSRSQRATCASKRGTSKSRHRAAAAACSPTRVAVRSAPAVRPPTVANAPIFDIGSLTLFPRHEQKQTPCRSGRLLTDSGGRSFCASSSTADRRERADI